MPNDDYIKRNDALHEILSIPKGNWSSQRFALAVEAVPAADVELKRKWIPVTDVNNLPKKSTPCLVACNQWGGEKVRKATYLDSEKRFYEGGFDITEYVTHWMPSPEPPKGEDDAD